MNIAVSYGTQESAPNGRGSDLHRRTLCQTSSAVSLMKLGRMPRQCANAAPIRSGQSKTFKQRREQKCEQFTEWR